MTELLVNNEEEFKGIKFHFNESENLEYLSTGQAFRVTGVHDVGDVVGVISRHVSVCALRINFAVNEEIVDLFEQ